MVSFLELQKYAMSSNMYGVGPALRGQEVEASRPNTALCSFLLKLEIGRCPNAVLLKPTLWDTCWNIFLLWVTCDNQQ